MLRQSLIRNLLILALSFLAFGISCGPKKVAIDPTKQSDSQLYTMGQERMKKKDYPKAKEAFKAVFENFPKSDYRILAKLAYADAYYQEGGDSNWILAAQEYQDFISLFPFSPKAEYAQFQIGMCYYKMMERPDRDQTNTHKAVVEFQKAIDSYPNGEHFDAARKKLIDCYDHLAKHEFGVARYYWRTKRYQPSSDRIKGLLKSYPETVYQPEYFYTLADSLHHLAQDSEACVYYAKLKARWPTADYHNNTTKYLDQHCEGAPAAPPVANQPQTEPQIQFQPEPQTQPQSQPETEPQSQP
ncbi:MAG TPA: outer membrane protein assembly factor BamD [Acidobacteriota bacterium]|nr:outer membrane protein assembly factor BamD [Acidobacteriota bacterium]